MNSSKDTLRIQEFLNVTFETIEEGITIYDDQLHLVAWNKTYTEMGITPRRFLYYGSSLLETYIFMAREGVFGEGDPNSLASSRVQALVSGPMIESEILTPPTGRIIRIRRFRLPNGGVCATFSDITAEVRLQEQLSQSQKLEATGRLTAGFSHDFNNLLAVIKGNLEMLSAEATEESTTSMVSTALEAARRGANLAEKLLAFGREARLQPEMTNINTLIRNSEPMLRQALSERVSLSLSLSGELWLAEVDRVQMENALLNLVKNSHDAIHSRGAIVIESKNVVIGSDNDVPPGRYVSISVIDDGAGMDDKVVTRALDPFFTTKAAGEGSGLGLAMIYGFIKQSGGGTQIKSEPGVGTTVDLCLPAASETIAPM